MKRIILVLAAVLSVMSAAWGADAVAAKPKPKTPKKQFYTKLDEATTVAKAWEQPILVLLTTKGSKEENFYQNLLKDRHAKEFITANYVVWQLKLQPGKPAKKSKDAGGFGSSAADEGPSLARLSSNEVAIVKASYTRNNGAIANRGIAVIASDGAKCIGSGGESGGKSAPQYTTDLTVANWLLSMETFLTEHQIEPKISTSLRDYIDNPPEAKASRKSKSK